MPGGTDRSSSPSTARSISRRSTMPRTSTLRCEAVSTSSCVVSEARPSSLRSARGVAGAAGAAPPGDAPLPKLLALEAASSASRSPFGTLCSVRQSGQDRQRSARAFVSRVASISTAQSALTHGVQSVCRHGSNVEFSSSRSSRQTAHSSCPSTASTRGGGADGEEERRKPGFKAQAIGATQPIRCRAHGAELASFVARPRVKTEVVVGGGGGWGAPGVRRGGDGLGGRIEGGTPWSGALGTSW